MTLPASGNPISINSLVGEYGGSAPHSINEYYRGGARVANHSNNGNVPTSGTISLSNFYGQSNTSPNVTSYSYSMTVGTDGSQRGFFSGVSGGGSLSPNPQTGGTFSSGFNPTIYQWCTNPVTSKTGTLSYTWFFRVNGHLPNSGWTSFTVPSGLTNDGTAQTISRNGCIHSQVTLGGGSRTEWSLSSQTRGFSGSNNSGTVTITA